MSKVVHVGGTTATSHEVAYAAGFFDGEGSIMLSRCYGVHRESRRDSYDLHSSLAQKDPRPLLWLRDRFGGSLTPYKSKYNHREGHCEMWGWRMASSQTLAFLRAVRPFLIVKATQADLAFAFAETKKVNYQGLGIPPEIAAERERIFQAMKDAKRDFSPVMSEAA